VYDQAPCSNVISTDVNGSDDEFAVITCQVLPAVNVAEYEHVVFKVNTVAAAKVTT
jgi:hypothetical protein